MRASRAPALIGPAMVVLVLVLATAGAAPVPATASGDATQVLPETRSVLLGRSVQGRPIVARRIGDLRSSRKALVVGNTHGDEPSSWLAARQLRRTWAIRGVDIWVIDTINPDGLARGTRQNARGVDLNRNFPHRWRRERRLGERFYQGPSPVSEPESRLVRDLVRRLRPAVSIWYHQPYGNVAIPSARPRVALRYAWLARWPAFRLTGPDYRGVINEWQNAVLPGTDAFVVEFGASRPSPSVVNRHVAAAIRVARGR